MLDRIARGQMPPKHHLVSRSAEGALHWEECLTRDGFEGPYTLIYHERRPHEQRALKIDHGWAVPGPAGARDMLAKRHFKGQDLDSTAGSPLDARVPMLFNADVTVSIVQPDRSDEVYFVNGDSDDLYFIHEGSGVLRSVLGDVSFKRHDYVFVPKGIVHRFVLPENESQYWLNLEAHGGLTLPKQWRNQVGQLRMDAPFCHRDFQRPAFVGPLDEGIDRIVVKRSGQFFGFQQPHSPLDAVGWDGTVYPFVFPILNFQPRAGLVHLPPTWHGNFAMRGGLVCSFVPRVVDFHPDAIPCPYPHSSVDVDEFIFYCEGNFTSRRGIDSKSISYHPAGIPHGPHPGAYEASLGTTRTDELAVMLDCVLPLNITDAARSIEDPNYQESFFS